MNTQPDPAAVHRQWWADDFNGPVATGLCMCGATWSPAHQGDTPGALIPGEADAPPAVDLAGRLDHVESLVGRILAAAAHGYVQIASGLAAAAKETLPPEVLAARIAAEKAAHPLVVVIPTPDDDAGLAIAPPGSEVEQQWCVRWLEIDSHEWRDTEPTPDRAGADRQLDDLSDVWGHHARLVTRSVITTSWQPEVDRG